MKAEENPNKSGIENNDIKKYKQYIKPYNILIAILIMIFIYVLSIALNSKTITLNFLHTEKRRKKRRERKEDERKQTTAPVCCGLELAWL